MNAVDRMLETITLPKMYRVRQRFSRPAIEDLEGAVRKELEASTLRGRVKHGDRIAVAVGSRGVRNVALFAKSAAAYLKELGAEPFIVPAMGSHGSASAEGQKRVLADMGIDERTMACPVVSSMDVVEVGELENGMTVYMDRSAFEADGVLLINRVKPHTAFRGPYESGLVKMLSIGLGNHRGATACHQLGFGRMADNIVEMAKVKIARARILGGLAVIENAYDETGRLEYVPAESILDREPALLVEAKTNMPAILFDPIDVLVVRRMGKEISGDGMDPNITGKYGSPHASGGPSVTRLVVLDLTEQSHGNAIGIGPADVCTKKLFEKIDFEATYANGLTSTVCAAARIPVVLETDEAAIRGGILTSTIADLSAPRLVLIRDTLSLEELYVSEELLGEAERNPDVSVESGPLAMRFSGDGTLLLGSEEAAADRV